jgi:hypothetical protein
MWVKLLFIIFFGTIGIAFLCDYFALDYVYSSAGRGIEHSIDAGIIKSGIVVDAQNGIVKLDGSSLETTVKKEFAKYMGMDSNLENKLLKDSNFELSLVYDQNEVPWVHVKFDTRMSFAIRGVEYPVKVNRKIDFESVYK